MFYLQNDVNNLEGWCENHSIYLNRKICLGTDHQSGIGVFSKDEYIQPQTTLVRISKSSVLSARSCSLAGVIPDAPYGLAAQLSLSLALLVEMLKGSDSRWYGYLQSFPAGIVDLPLFWDLHLGTNISTTENQNAITGSACLRGTEAAKIRDKTLENGHTTLEEVTHFYHKVAEPTLLRHSTLWRNGEDDTASNPNLLRFYCAFSAVSSRAFLVDAYHGLAMVPIADAFNHVLENHVHLESDYNVCAECGSLYECAHDRDDRSPHKMEPPVIPGTSDDADDLFYEMVANAGIPPNTEIFNTYGEELTNAQLLNQYGFILDVNDNDQLSWGMDDILGVFTTHLRFSRDALILELRRAVACLPEGEGHRVFADSQLVYHEAATEYIFCLNADGIASHQLWALLFTLSVWKCGSDGTTCDVLELLPAVLAVQINIEHTEIDGDDGEDEDANMDDDDGAKYSVRARELAHLEQLALQVLLEMCRLMVQLCNVRKANTGPEGLSAEQLSDVMDMEVSEGSNESKRIKLAISLVIGERSILDACEAAWASVMESAEQLLRTVSDDRGWPL